MDFDTGRQEWDDEYEAMSSEAKNSKAKTSEIKPAPVATKKDPRLNAVPRQPRTQPQRLTVPTAPRIQLQSQTSLKETRFKAKKEFSQTNVETSSFLPNSGQPSKTQNLQPYKAPSTSSKPFENKKKLEGSWAKTPKLITTRKSQQIAMDEENKKYLGAPPGDVEFQFMGYFCYNNIELVSSQGVDKKWDPIRLGFQVYITLDEPGKVIIVRADKEHNCVEAIMRIRATMLHAEADEQTTRARYIVEPPLESTMRKEVILFEASKLPNDASTQRVELAGPLLSGEDLKQWGQKRKELIASNEQDFKTHLGNAFERLCGINSSMRMRVQFGNITLTRYRAEMTKPGATYEAFVKMMAMPRIGATFEKMIGGIAMGSQIIAKINQFPDMFCPLDVMVGNLSDMKPKQRLLYLTKRGNVTYRLEAEIDISARGEYQLGANTLFEEETALKKRMEVCFFGFDSKFHWSLEVLTKDNLTSNSVAIQNTARELLESVVVKQDELGFPYPTLGPKTRLNGDDKADIHTMLQYKLMGTPYVLAISLYRGIGTDTIGYCGASMYSKDWDDQMGPAEGQSGDRWKLGSDLGLLFPPPETFPVPGSTQTADKHAGVRSFLATVEMIKNFLSTPA